MIRSLRIRNYRRLKDLQIPRLARLNLFVGENNGGKSSLLEALLLLGSGGNPTALMNEIVARRISYEKNIANVASRNTWTSMFSNLDYTNPITVRADHSTLKALSLSIAVDHSRETSPLGIARIRSNKETDAVARIRLDFAAEGTNHRFKSYIYETNGTVEVDLPDELVIPFATSHLSPNHRSIEDEVLRFGELKVVNKDGKVLEALRMVEPTLRSISESAVSGRPMLWCDVGLERHLPLSTMGNGMIWITSLVGTLLASSNGLLLIDEIDNGIHHSTLSKVWTIIDSVSRENNTQVVATTHSYEGVRAMASGVESDDVRLHRLEVMADGSNRCATYGPELISAAIEHRMEVR